MAALVLMPERECFGCKRQDEWGCHARKIKDQPGEDEEERDCWINPALIGTKLDGEEIFVCPRRPILDNTPFWEHILTLHRGFESGFLPDPGGIQDQSAAGLKALGILKAALTKARADANSKE